MAGHLQGTVSNPQVSFWQNKVNTLTPQVQAAQAAMDKAQAAYQCEVDGSGPGCEGASDRAGRRADRPAQAHGADSGAAEVPRPERSAAVRAAAASDRPVGGGEGIGADPAAAAGGSEGRASPPGEAVQPARGPAEENEAQAQGAVEHNTGILAQLQDLSTAGTKDPMLGSLSGSSPCCSSASRSSR